MSALVTSGCGSRIVRPESALEGWPFVAEDTLKIAWRKAAERMDAQGVAPPGPRVRIDATPRCLGGRRSISAGHAFFVQVCTIFGTGVRLHPTGQSERLCPPERQVPACTDL